MTPTVNCPDSDFNDWLYRHLRLTLSRWECLVGKIVVRCVPMAALLQLATTHHL
jgi:hypothetical protein